MTTEGFKASGLNPALDGASHHDASAERDLRQHLEDLAGGGEKQPGKMFPWLEFVCLQESYPALLIRSKMDC